MKISSNISIYEPDFARLERFAFRPRFGVIHNPLSAGNHGKSPLRLPGIVHASPSTPSELESTLAEFAQREVNIVVVSGGDGTVREVLTAIPRAYSAEPPPAIAIVAAGSTDLIAGEVGACASPLDVETLLARARDGTLRRTRRPIVRVEKAVNDRGETITVRGMLFGAGIFSQATELGQSILRERGTNHSAMVARTVATLVRRLVLEGDPDGLMRGQPIRLRASARHVPPTDHPDRFLVIVSGLRERLFLGRTLFWGAESDDELRFVSIAGPARHVARSFASLAINRPWLAGEDWHSGSSNALELDMSTPFVVDGEMFHPPPDGTVRLRADSPITFVSP